MKKRILSALVLLALIVPMASSMAASSAITSLKNELINANKKVLNNAANNAKETAKANTVGKVDAKIAAYEKQIAAKEAEIKKIKENENYKWTEKYKKVKAVNSEIKELKAAIKALK